MDFSAINGPLKNTAESSCHPLRGPFSGAADPGNSMAGGEPILGNF